MSHELKILAQYRLEKALENISDAQNNFNNDRIAVSVNRSYYAIFHAIRAVLALDKFDSKRHSSIIGYFNKHYLATGIIDKRYSLIVTSAFKLRNSSDYDDFYKASREEAATQLKNAGEFVQMIQEHLKRVLPD